MNTPDVEISELSTLDFLCGQVFKETRPEAIASIQNRIRRYRKNRGTPPEHLYLRVLGVVDREVAVISIEDPFPSVDFYPLRQARHYVSAGLWRETDREPMPVMRLLDGDLSPRQQECRKRNEAIISPLIRAGCAALVSGTCWKIIRGISAETRRDGTQIYKIFLRFLQGGMSTRALAGRWFRRMGGIGRGARVEFAIRAGVPRKPTGRPRLDGSPSFVVYDPDVKKMIAGNREFYFDPVLGGNPIQAWALTIAKYYLEIDFDNFDRARAVEEVGKYFRPGLYPSRIQFNYWVKLDGDYERLTRQLYGNREFNRNLRRKTKTTAAKVQGPGAVFQIDATPLDWILVHQVTRLPLERKAVLYLVVDCYSHLIVGFHLYLGSECYDAVALALLTTAEDKPTFCARWGVSDLKPNEWPSKCLPTELAGDGKLSSYRHLALVRDGTVASEAILPPYRCDLKALNEAYNAAITKRAETIPGYTKGPKTRGDEKPEALACLDCVESTQLIISWIRQRNGRILVNYQPDERLMAANIILCPALIWTHMCPETVGLRKTRPREELMKMCLPTEHADMTGDGLVWRQMLYEPAAPGLDQFGAWCTDAKLHGSWEEKVTFHPDALGTIWLHKNGRLIPMQHAEKSHRLSRWSLADLEGYRATKAAADAAHRSGHEVADILLRTEQHAIVHKGMKRTLAVRGSVAQRSREKVDRSAATQSQQRLRSPDGAVGVPAKASVPITVLHDEDEAAINRFLEEAT
jgi:hypothetical protein